jgi:DNA-binding response OmpR family regulator
VKSKRVLVVDDSEPCLRICVIALTQAGYRVSTARSVPDALRALSVEMPDALVCDLLLGTIGTGFDVIAAVRTLGAKIFCVAVTGLPTVQIREDAMVAGFDAFLFKPFKPSELVALLR